jgi:hypothetical protein
MPITAFVRIRDAGGGAKPATSLVSVEIPTSTTPANAIAFARALASMVEPLTIGGIVGAGITIEADISALALDAVGTALADVQERAVFVFRTLLNKTKRIGIPCFNENLFNAAGALDTVDVEDEDVDAFITGMISGVDVSTFGGTGTVTPVDTNNSDLTLLEAASQDFSSRRG